MRPHGCLQRGGAHAGAAVRLGAGAEAVLQLGHGDLKGARVSKSACGASISAAPARSRSAGISMVVSFILSQLQVGGWHRAGMA